MPENIGPCGEPSSHARQMQTLSRRSPLVWRLLGCPPPAPPESGLSTVIAVTCRVDRLAAGEEPGRVAVSRRARGALNNALQGLWKRRLDRATDLLLPMAASTSVPRCGSAPRSGAPTRRFERDVQRASLPSDELGPSRRRQPLGEQENEQR